MKRLENPYQGYNNTTDGIHTIRDSRHAYHDRFQAGHEGGIWLTIATLIAVIALTTLLFLIAMNSAHAQAPQLYDRQTGKYLGNLSANQLDPNSVNNPMGRYGNPLSPDSINNTMGQYGSPLSNSSVNNPFATNAPVIVAPQGGWSSNWGN